LFAECTVNKGSIRVWMDVLVYAGKHACLVCSLTFADC
jgi:hypothetical protein